MYKARNIDTGSSARGESPSSGSRLGRGAREQRRGPNWGPSRRSSSSSPTTSSSMTLWRQPDLSVARSQPRHHRRARRDRRRRPARCLPAPRSRERSDPRADRRGIDASGLLRRLAQGDEGVDRGSEDTSPLTERDASGSVVYLSRRALNLGLRPDAIDLRKNTKSVSTSTH